MPYIKQEARQKFDELISTIVCYLEQDRKNFEGNLNYIVSSIIKRLTLTNYKEMNGAIGALECIKQELYRRQISSYEDEKLRSNGDLQ